MLNEELQLGLFYLRFGKTDRLGRRKQELVVPHTARRELGELKHIFRLWPIVSRKGLPSSKALQERRAFLSEAWIVDLDSLEIVQAECAAQPRLKAGHADHIVRAQARLSPYLVLNHIALIRSATVVVCVDVAGPSCLPPLKHTDKLSRWRTLRL